MTILYKKDWFNGNGKPRAVVHTNTKNTSFLRMHLLLQNMGISNNLFFLSLYDPALKNVDPHELDDDNDPTGDLRFRVGVECKRNVWYFLREVVRLPSPGGDPIQFSLHRGNLAMTWCFFAHIDFNGTQPRQTGKTICAVTLSTYIVYILGVSMKVIMLTHCDDLVQENVKRVKDIRDMLPQYLLSKSGLDIDNKSGLDYKALKNVYDTRVGQKDKIAANKLGRGSTAPVLHIDELAFIPNIQITFPAIMASTNESRRLARLAGMPHSNIYTTTAGDPTTTEGKYALDIVSQGMKFTEKLFDTEDNEATVRMVNINSENGLVNGTFSYLQLGKTHQWFKETIRRNNVPPDEIARDYLNQWIALAKNPIVDKNILAIMEANKKHDPEFKEIYGDYLIDWYIPRAKAKSVEFRKKKLIMGMDGAEGVGRDFTTFVCIDPQTLAVVFTFRCNDANTTNIGLLVDTLMRTYSGILFVPERKNSGVFITDMLTELLLSRGVQPLTRIYSKIVDQMDKAEFKDVNIYDPETCRSTMRKYIGFMTSANTRTLLYKSVLQRAAFQGARVVHDPVLINEICGLQATGGRIDHKSKEHDDMVIAWLLACYVIFEGRNLHIYGLTDDDLPKPIDENGDPVNTGYIELQMEVRKNIKELEMKARTAPTAWQRENYNYQIRKLSTYLDDSVNPEPISADSVRTRASEYRGMYRKPEDGINAARPLDLQELVDSIHY